MKSIYILKAKNLLYSVEPGTKDTVELVAELLEDIDELNESVEARGNTIDRLMEPRIEELKQEAYKNIDEKMCKAFEIAALEEDIEELESRIDELNETIEAREDTISRLMEPRIEELIKKQEFKEQAEELQGTLDDHKTAIINVTKEKYALKYKLDRISKAFSGDAMYKIFTNPLSSLKSDMRKMLDDILDDE